VNYFLIIKSDRAKESKGSHSINEDTLISMGRTHLYTSIRMADQALHLPMQHYSLLQSATKSLMALALLALIPGCSSTHIKSTRYAAGTGAASFRNVVVAGVDQNPDVREPFENETATLLAEHGVKGTASHTMLSLEELNGNKEQLRQRLIELKAESLLIVRVTERADFVEEEAPVTLGSMEITGESESRFNEFLRPGGDVDTALRLGARLYRVSDGALMWSGVLDATIKEDQDRLVFIRRTAETIVQRLAKDKLIP
jgi:hypothetical protein